MCDDACCAFSANSMLTKRRFWKAEQKIAREFSMRFSIVGSPHRVLTPCAIFCSPFQHRLGSINWRLSYGLKMKPSDQHRTNARIHHVGLFFCKHILAILLKMKPSDQHRTHVSIMFLFRKLVRINYKKKDIG